MRHGMRVRSPYCIIILMLELYCLNSSWNKTVSKILLETYLSEPEKQPEHTENLLKLFQLVAHNFQTFANRLSCHQTVKVVKVARVYT